MSTTFLITILTYVTTFTFALKAPRNKPPDKQKQPSGLRSSSQPISSKQSTAQNNAVGLRAEHVLDQHNPLKNMKLVFDPSYIYGLDHGGQSTVLRFKDLNTGKSFALKFFNKYQKNVIPAGTASQLGKKEIEHLSKAYYNDVAVPYYLGDSNCASINSPIIYRAGPAISWTLNSKYKDAPPDTWQDNEPALSAQSLKTQLAQAIMANDDFQHLGESGSGGIAGMMEDIWKFPMALYEFAEHGDLWRAMMHTKPLDFLQTSEILSLLKSMLEAIALMHKSGWIHRDVKPENILVHGPNHYTLADFGLAGGEQSTGQRTIVGSKPYLPPETWGHCANLDKSRDLFSLGVCVYILTSRCDLWPKSLWDQLQDAKRSRDYVLVNDLLKRTFEKLEYFIENKMFKPRGLVHGPEHEMKQIEYVFRKLLARHADDRGTAQELLNYLNTPYVDETALKLQSIEENQFAKKPFVVFVVGGPGCGKGTQCERLSKEFNLVHLSTGDLLRNELASGTALGQELKRKMQNGELVSNKIVLDLLRKAMLEKQDVNRFLIDGYPRALEQAIQFEDSVANVDFVLYLDATAEAMAARIIERGKTSGRADDNPETIKKRLDTYFSQTEPVIEYYKNLGKVKAVNGMQSIDQVYADTSRHFEDYQTGNFLTSSLNEVENSESNDNKSKPKPSKSSKAQKSAIDRQAHLAALTLAQAKEKMGKNLLESNSNSKIRPPPSRPAPPPPQQNQLKPIPPPPTDPPPPNQFKRKLIHRTAAKQVDDAPSFATARTNSGDTVSTDVPNSNFEDCDLETEYQDTMLQQAQFLADQCDGNCDKSLLCKVCDQDDNQDANENSSNAESTTGDLITQPITMRKRCANCLKSWYRFFSGGEDPPEGGVKKFC